MTINENKSNPSTVTVTYSVNAIMVDLNFLLFVPVCGLKLRLQENRVLVDYKEFTKMNCSFLFRDKIFTL